MDSVYIYKQQLINFIFSIENDNISLDISLNDFLYLILSDKSSNNEKTSELVSRMLKTFNKDKRTIKVGVLKKLISYIKNNGLNEEKNNQLYNYLLLQQYISNSDRKININNEKELINQYKIKTNEIFELLTQ